MNEATQAAYDEMQRTYDKWVEHLISCQRCRVEIHLCPECVDLNQKHRDARDAYEVAEAQAAGKCRGCGHPVALCACIPATDEQAPR